MNIKHIVILLAGIGFFVSAKQNAFAVAPPVREQAWTSEGTGTTVSVSTSTWTKIPTTSSLTGRTSIVVSNDSANGSKMAFITSTNSSTPSEATTVRPYYLDPGQFIVLGVGDARYFYGIYLGAAAANVHCKEYSQ